jgi:hypothetical protein
MQDDRHLIQIIRLTECHKADIRFRTKFDIAKYNREKRRSLIDTEIDLDQQFRTRGLRWQIRDVMVEGTTPWR